MITSMMRRAMFSGDGPPGATLSLNFAQMSTLSDLTSRGLTFSRSTSGTRINASGYVETVSAGNPRFDYDPTTLAPRGLLIEGTATNLLKHSQGLFTNWILFGTVGALTTGITSPAGDSSAVSLNLNTAGNNGYYTNNTQMGYTNTVGGTYTFSIWVRATGSATNIRLGDSAAGYSANIPITTSWQRLQYQYVAVAGSGPVIASATGTATGLVELWGAQLETGSGASSYIPTGASTAQRLFDSCVMENITSLQYSTTNGSMYYEGRFTQLNSTSFPLRFGFTKETGDERVFGFLTNSGGSSVEAKGPGATPTANVSTTVAINTDYKLAWSLDAALSSGEVRRSLNGSAVSVSGATAMTVTGTPTYLMFGQKGYGLYFPAGTIKSAKYWPSTLSDAQLQSLTT